jgi:predicted SAM-dependent methyltransferase
MKAQNEKKLYVQYGCGLNAPRNWINFDVSPTLRFEKIPILGKVYTKNASRFPTNARYGDIVKGLPLKDLSCRAVYCSHVLEHLSLEDFRKALSNTYRILQYGGIFRFVLPDLQVSVEKYLHDPSPDAALIFLKETLLGKEKRLRGLKGLLLQMLGNSQHLWMWDYKAIERELEVAGFKEVRRAIVGDSMDPMFKEVEEAEKWSRCLGVECKKVY